MTDLKELLADCPFCGATLVRHEQSAVGPYWGHPVDRSNDFCPAAGWYITDTDTARAESVAAWNRRALIQPTPAETEPVAWQKRWIGGAVLGDWELCTSAASVESFRAANSSRYEYRPLYASPTPPPIGDGEGPKPVAWHWMASNHNSTWPVWVEQSDRPRVAPETAVPLYDHAAIEALRAERDAAVIRANNLVNDTVQMGLARDSAEARISTAITALEEIVAPTQTRDLAWWQTKIRQVVQGLEGKNE